MRAGAWGAGAGRGEPAAGDAAGTGPGAGAGCARCAEGARRGACRGAARVVQARSRRAAMPRQVWQGARRRRALRSQDDQLDADCAGGGCMRRGSDNIGDPPVGRHGNCCRRYSAVNKVNTSNDRKRAGICGQVCVVCHKTVCRCASYGIFCLQILCSV